MIHNPCEAVYLQAYAIVPNSLLLSNIGAELQKSGKPDEALHYFCLYLESDPNGTNAVYATSQARQLQAVLGTPHVTDDDVCAPAKPDDRPAPPPAPPPPPPEAHSSTARNAGIAVGIVGAAALGVGVYAGVKAKHISDEISGQDPNHPWPPGIRGLQHSGQSYQDLQIGTLIGGAAALGVGVYLILRGAEPEPERTVRLTPTTNGVAVFGQF